MYSILVIDDDLTSTLMLERILKKEGYQVTITHNGATGITQFFEVKPALIICDWVMAEVDGIAVCQAVKAHQSLCATFFILLTSKGAVSDRIEGLNAGADELLAKPIDPNELIARVRAGLRWYDTNLALQRQTQKLEAELAEAANYVGSLLPPPMETPFRIETLFLPSRQLGGDCFDYFWLSPTQMAFYLLDVSGHGLGSALPSVSILNLLRSRGLQDVNYQNPAQVLTRLNTMFQMSQQGGKYFTIWYGVFDAGSHQLTYACAGHPPALLWNPQDSTLKTLKTPGLPIGFFPESDYGNQTSDIPEKSTIYLFSDGLFDSSTTDTNIEGLVVLGKILQDNPQWHNESLTQMFEQIRHELHLMAYEDDISLMKVQFLP
jgi:phosphoserine phosphatase RsbU/P